MRRFLVPAFSPALARCLFLFAGCGAALAQQQQQPQQQIPQPAPPVPQQTPAPTSAPPEISPDDPDYGEPVTFYYWLSKGTGITRPGQIAAVPQDQTLSMPDASPRTPGVSLSMPAGKFNHLELSYFQTDGSGTGTALTPLALFGSNVPQGDLISTTYRVRFAQLTWNYLNWPVPPEDSKFRIHSLFSFSYTSDSVTVDAPYETSASFMPPHGSRNIFFPTFGLQAEYIPSKHFYIQGRAYGFGWIHKADVAGAEVSIIGRIKHLELFGGYKFFHFKTSPASDQFFVQTLTGPMVGARWVLR